MNFESTDEIRALQDSLSRLLAERFTMQDRQAVVASASGYSEEVWKALGTLGVTALLVPEDEGGFGTSVTALLPVLRELGRSLVPVPFVSSCVLGAVALRAATHADARALLPELASGDVQVAWMGSSEQLAQPVRAARGDDGWRLDGEAAHVPYAASADFVIVAAGIVDGEEQGGLFLVRAGGAGMRLRPHRLIDGMPAAGVRLVSCEAVPLLEPGTAEARDAIGAVNAAGIAAVCAEMVGLMESAFRLTVEYLNTRKQFGRLIGENQALRHRVAEMLVGLEMARSMAIAAAVAAEGAGFREASTRADLHRAKFLVGRNARSVCQQAIQLHGGIGMTEEYEVGHYLRRVHVLDPMFGEPGEHAARLAAEAA